jgi:tetratricopeptide (TPR) repeat protein
VFFRAWLVWSLTRLGEFAEGVRWGQETIELAAAIDQPLALAVAHYTFGFLRLDKGDLEWAIASLERSLDLCRTWHLPAWFPNIASSLGYAYALAGRLDEGVSLLEQAVEETAATGVMVRHSIEVAMLGHAHLLAGRTAEAWSLGRRALELAKTHSERGNEAAAFRLLGEVAAQEGPPQPGVAERHFRDGLALAQACAARPLVAACHLGLGRLFQGTGARPSAAEHLGRAVDLYREMEMPFWLAKAEAAFREVGE